MWILPRFLIELVPVIATLLVSGLGWGAAMYTKHHAHDRDS
jgi:hypothetical protein